MEELDNLIKEYYKKCVGLPSNNPIVRNNQENDAFEAVMVDVLKLYSRPYYSGVPFVYMDKQPIELH